MKFRLFVVSLFFSLFVSFVTTPFIGAQDVEPYTSDLIVEIPEPNNIQEVDDSWYLGRPIRDIAFSGLRNISASELDGLMDPFKGRSFGYNIFDEISDRLLRLEYFDQIEPSLHRSGPDGNEVVIRFNVIERPVVNRITFVGNSNIRRVELNDVITSRVRDTHNQSKVRVDIEAIINKYIEKGFPNVTVEVSEISTGAQSINLIFNINEGDRITITRIDFHGNSRFSNNTLRSQLSLKAKSLLNDGAFQEAKLLVDREALTMYYHDRGFINMQVRDVTRTIDTDSKGTNLILTFMIEEGNEFRFGGITFTGNEIFSDSQLQRLVNSKIGDIVNMTRLENDMQRIADIYFENGYIFNNIRRIPDANNLTNVLSITIEITERGRAYIESITILGNRKTRDEVILREIPLEPGDVFSKTKIMEAMRNLFNLQYFSMIIPDTLPGSTENLMDLVFSLEEQPTTDISFGLTFSGSADPDTFPISGLLRWNDRNLAGTGNELGAEINSSVVDSATFSVNYLHRWAFGLPLSLGTELSAFYTTRLAKMNNQAPFFHGDEDYAFPDGFSSWEEYISSDRIPTRDYLMDYEQWFLSVAFSSGYRWATPAGIFGLSGGMRFGALRNSYNSEIFRPFDPALRAGNNTWIPRHSFWFAISLDQRDIFWDPSRGYYIYERIGFHGILNNEKEHYMRSDTRLQYYYTLFNLPVSENWNFKCVFAFHTGLSLLFNQPFPSRREGRVPFIEEANKLAVDGMFVGRGWSSEFHRKGLLLLDSWVELRFPLVPGVLAFDLFFDTAGVESEQGYYFGINQSGDRNFTFENLRFSYGGGIRFTIPQFPIRLSLAKRFKIVDGKVDWQPGALFGDPNNPRKGMDLVVSFVLAY
ncbi:MAG: outer membrane protein assembly factor BamA [Treponema sp.]|jgi:outer membrane protein insertion porin family|nr:outer membrane protein assembly factor BamA [Treponema sp.]